MEELRNNKSKQWCQDAAREFVARKSNERNYRMKLYVSNNDDCTGETYDVVRALSAEEVAKYQAFQDRCWAEYKKDYPEDFDANGNCSEDTWKEYLKESYSIEGFEDYICFEGCEQNGAHIFSEYTYEFQATVEYVDLENPVVYCKLYFVDLDDKSEADEKKYSCSIYVTEEEYVQILADYLYEPRIMITHLRDFYPKIYKEITEHGIKDNHRWSVIFDNIRKDAGEILLTRSQLNNETKLSQKKQ